MAYLREHFPEINISPKLHMLEEHMIPFISKWKVGCGFFGEQGGESIHAAFNNMTKDYRQIKRDWRTAWNNTLHLPIQMHEQNVCIKYHTIWRGRFKMEIYSLLDIQ